jgi:peptide chain release factor 1
MLKDNDYDMRQMAHEELSVLLPQKLDIEERIKLLLIPKDPADSKNVILEIRSGTGGDEAAIFASDLLRMYSRYMENKGWKTEVLDVTEGVLGGYSKIVLEIQGDEVYGHLKFESGAHRVQRVPKTESQGRVHTSAATVAIIPVWEDEEININRADLKIDTFRASGAGGQHVNKTESAVRVRHLPTGLVAECQQERSQHQNREKAIQLLKSRIYELELQKQLAERAKVESGKMKNEWGSQIRSYVLDDRRVKDHRSQYQTSQTDAVLDGDLQPFLKAFLMMDGVHPDDSDN